AAVKTAVAAALLGIYIAWRALAGDEKHAFIRTIAVAFAATGGTSFRQADLTNADFTQATLKSTDFRGAILTRTCWHEAKRLDRARVGNSILAKAAVRDLLITGNGYKKSYTGENLQGANLTGANLNQANLKEADISQAKLQGANLERANLTKTQAVGTDFTNAYLTGACLEAWNIDSTTKLEQVDCQYVFLLEYPDAKGSRERHPHYPDKVFESGDFEKLYKKIMNTVQILLRNGLNREAFNIAFQKLMEENPGITCDSLQGIQKKDNDVLVTIQVPEGTDKGKIERDLSEPYKLEAQKQAALLEAEIRHNQDLKKIAILALTKNPASNPIINLTNDLKSEIKAMTDSIDQSRKIENKDGHVIGILGDIGTISGTVAHTINQLPDEPTKSEQPGIKELLSQLHQAIEADPALKAEDKAEALEQLQTLAEAGKNPKQEATQKTAKNALTMLKGIIFGLPSAVGVVEACNKLLPAIAQLFGL
ncbi:pentapeptide repeat-containing protein, partial [Kamptonema animale CS-326]|uniref:pentapeptide repeat-containing protein n=1 Tax=Kamptonema animale TaxID=92934 RepID=UPI00232DC13D